MIALIDSRMFTVIFRQYLIRNHRGNRNVELRGLLGKLIHPARFRPTLDTLTTLLLTAPAFVGGTGEGEVHAQSKKLAPRKPTG